MNTFAQKSDVEAKRPHSLLESPATGEASRTAGPGGQNRFQNALDRSPRVVGQMKLARALSGRANSTAATGPVQRQPVVQRVQLPTDRTGEMIKFLEWEKGIPHEDLVAMSKTQLIETYQAHTTGNEKEVLSKWLKDWDEQGVDELGEEQMLERYKQMTRPDTGTGLALDEMVNAYAGDVSRLDVSEWQSKEPLRKVSTIVDFVNAYLTETGTPKVRLLFENLAPDTNGIFDHVEWAMTFNKLLFDPKHPEYEKTNLGKVMNTVYHEARHAQQWYRVATLLAGDGLNAQAIGQKTGIKVEAVLNFAEAHPLKRTAGDVQDVKEAIAWEDSFIGPFAQEKTKIRTDLFNTEKEIGDLASKRAIAESGYTAAQHDYENLKFKIGDFKTQSQSFDRAKRNLLLWQSINQEKIGWAEKFEKFEKAFESGPSEEFDTDLEAEFLGEGTTNETTNEPPELTENDWLAQEGFLKEEILTSSRKALEYQEEFKKDPIKQQQERFQNEYKFNMASFKKSSLRMKELEEPYKSLFQKYKDFVEEHDAFDIGDLAQQRYGELIQKKAAPGNVVQKVDLSEEVNRQPLLDLIKQAEENSVFGSGMSERARLYLESLDEQPLEEVGRAVDAVERYVDGKEALEDEPVRSQETTQKILLSKARLLVKLMSGEVTAKGLNQESDKIQENLWAASEVEDLGNEAIGEESSSEEDSVEVDSIEVDSVEEAKKAFSKEVEKQGLFKLSKELEPLFGNFPNANLSPLVTNNGPVLLGASQYERLIKLLPKIEETTTAIRESGNPQAERVIKEFKSWLLMEIFSGKTSAKVLEEIPNLGPQQFLQEKREFIEGKSEFLSHPERTPEEVQEAIRQDIQTRQTTGHQKAVEQQELDRTRLREFIENGAETAPVGSPFRNACEWLLSGRSKIYALTRTHDSETRPLNLNSTRTESWFPKWETGAGDVFHDATDYSDTNNDNVFFATRNTLGGSTPDGSVVIHGASQMSDEELRRTIVHEVQHSSDMHDLTPLSRFQSEVNAYLLGHEQHPEEFLAGKGAEETAEGEGGTWNARVKAIFEHMRSSGGYSYLGEAWGLNENDFKEKVRAIQGPSTPNPINSVRIADFNQAIGTGVNLAQAYQALDPYDLAALKNNPATLALLERHLEDGQLELYKSYFQ